MIDFPSLHNALFGATAFTPKNVDKSILDAAGLSCERDTPRLGEHGVNLMPSVFYDNDKQVQIGLHICSVPSSQRAVKVCVKLTAGLRSNNETGRRIGIDVPKTEVIALYHALNGFTGFFKFTSGGLSVEVNEGSLNIQSHGQTVEIATSSDLKIRLSMICLAVYRTHHPEFEFDVIQRLFETTLPSEDRKIEEQAKPVNNKSEKLDKVLWAIFYQKLKTHNIAEEEMNQIFEHVELEEKQALIDSVNEGDLDPILKKIKMLNL